MHTLRRFKATILGQDTSVDGVKAQLGQGGVPMTEADCRTCPDPCDEGHEPYPTRFDVDMETQMLGSVKPYHRQIVISTGKIDWDREVTDTRGSLAAHVQHVVSKASSVPSSSPSDSKMPKMVAISGVFNSSDTTKIAILNGSHHSLSDDPEVDTVLVFPDYKLVTEVPRSAEGAQTLWNHFLNPSLSGSKEHAEKTSLHSWLIPYSCVILLCSHKRRDNRCSIAAAKLGTAFTHALEQAGWTVDTEVDYPSHTLGKPLEEIQGTSEEQEGHVAKQLHELAGLKKALVLRNSHTGGHKYAGNCIIYTPHGSGVWYGRVTTHEVNAIVSQTIEKGLVLPPLLRGGVNLSRPGCKSLYDW